MESLKRIKFNNRKAKEIGFEILKIEDLMSVSTSSMEQYHIQDFYSVFFFFEGNTKHGVNYIDYNIESNSIVVIPKHQIHKFFKSDEVKGYVLLFTEVFLKSLININFFEQWYMRDGISISPVISKTKEDMLEYISMLNLIYKEYIGDEPLKEDIIKNFASIMVIRISREIDGNMKKVNNNMLLRYYELKKLIEHNYEKRLAVEDYAKLMYLSKKSVNQITQKVIGKSAKEFIVDKTILEMKRLIAKGDFAVNEISEMFNFDTPSNFTKYFKRYAGLTPSEFKKSLNIS